MINYKFFWVGMMMFFYICSPLFAQKTENVVLITLDGLRWEEMFSGADPMLIANLEYVKDTGDLKMKFWKENAEDRRKTLLPFFWDEIVKNGQIHGNRDLGSKVNCSNIFWFSYPGYGEILCGKSNANAIRSNDKINNPDTTFLELLNLEKKFKGQVAAFCSWDVFPFIINEDRSGIPVNAAFEKADHDKLSVREKFLNELLDEIPSPWSTVRLDAFTQHYAIEYVEKYQPRVMYISYGETDDFAHDGRYDHYLQSAHQTDEFIGELWSFLQTKPQYRDKTTLIVTTDHGRGSYVDGGWKSHGTKYEGSNAIWYAILGPDSPALGEVAVDEQLWQNQFAATCLQLLGHTDLISSEMGVPLPNINR